MGYEITRPERVDRPRALIRPFPWYCFELAGVVAAAVNVDAEESISATVVGELGERGV